MRRNRILYFLAACSLCAVLSGPVGEAAEVPMSRGQWLRTLYESRQTSETTSGAFPSGAGFSDVSERSDGYEAALWAKARGISQGYDREHFQPDSPITRLQAAVMLYRYEQAIFGGSLSAAAPESAEWAVFPVWGRSAAAWAVTQGVWFSGTEAADADGLLDAAEGNAMIYAASVGGMKPSGISLSRDAGAEIALSGVGPEGAAVTLTNRGSSPLEYGRFDFLQLELHGVWYAQRSGKAFTMVAHKVAPGKSDSWDTVWRDSHGALPAGNYRLVLPVDERVLTDGAYSAEFIAAEFTIY